MSLFRLIYASLRESHSLRELDGILEQSEARNAVDAITGVLLVTRNYYLQMLEGRREVVNACYQRICRDPRHSRVSLILFEPVEERLFPDWSMSAVDMSEEDVIGHHSESEELRPEELPKAIVEKLFRDVAARLRRS